MRHDHLFLETLATLGERAQRGISEYEVIMVAALLPASSSWTVPRSWTL
jgi:hypothetical protein